MEDQETVAARSDDRGVTLFERRGVRILIGIVSTLALLPVAGMVFIFAIVPALPLVLATVLVIKPQHWIETFDEEVEILLSRPRHHHHAPAHA